MVSLPPGVDLSVSMSEGGTNHSFTGVAVVQGGPSFSSPVDGSTLIFNLWQVVFLLMWWHKICFPLFLCCPLTYLSPCSLQQLWYCLSWRLFCLQACEKLEDWTSVGKMEILTWIIVKRGIYLSKNHAVWKAQLKPKLLLPLLETFIKTIRSLSCIWISLVEPWQQITVSHEPGITVCPASFT